MNAPVVIGSGPSGVAVAAALIAGGQRPTIVDPGLVAGQAAMHARQQAQVDGPVESNHAGSAPAMQNAGQKSWFGSNISFEQPPTAGIEYDPDITVRASFAAGGFSRVWGGTFAFHEHYRDWPALTVPQPEDLALVKALVPASLTSWDGLMDPVSPGLVPGSQASLEAMRRFSAADTHGQWRLTPSTVAIDTRRSASMCRPCGLCLSGCPHDSIWFSGDQIQRWASAGAIDYRPGHRVLSVAEHADGVHVHTDTGATITADKVYLAAGVIGTAAILITSGLTDSLVVRDTGTAFVAALSLRPSPASLPSHALSQWWVRSADDQFSAQIYAPNALHVARLAERLPGPARRDSVLRRVALRLHPVIAYLDPDLSDQLAIKRAGPSVRVSALPNPQAPETFRGYVNALAATFGRAGYFLPVAATEFSPPGTGYHSGGSVPHGRSTDALGRWPGLQRVHVVDSSVLPGLEVGSVTPTVMANAARIGRESLREAP